MTALQLFLIIFGLIIVIISVVLFYFNSNAADSIKKGQSTAYLILALVVGLILTAWGFYLYSTEPAPDVENNAKVVSE